VDSILQPYNRQVEILNLKSNFAKLVTFSVNFVEDNAPLICQIIGFALTGQFKLDLCLQLIQNVVTEIPVSFNLMKQMVEEVVQIIKDSSTKTTTVVATQEKKAKKKLSSSRSNTTKS
jgi:hypothetical protein